MDAKQYLVPIAVVLGAVVVTFLLIFGGFGRGNAPTASQEADISKVAMTSPFIGDEDAPTAVAIYFDYQCPFCKQFELAAVPALMDYVTSGKTKIVFKDYQFLGNDSLDAALFARALFDLYPDQFGPWMTAMMQAQDEEGDQGFGDLASIKELTASMPGIDVERVAAELEKNRAAYEAAILADRAEGASFGINGTPTIIVGTKLLSGLSSENFVAAIKAELDAQLESQ